MDQMVCSITSHEKKAPISKYKSHNLKRLWPSLISFCTKSDSDTLQPWKLANLPRCVTPTHTILAVALRSAALPASACQ